jgi:dGTPase
MVPGIGQVVASACLAHDMGNPPFGHSGEKAIQAFFTEGEGLSLREQVSPELWQDLTHFEGNANAFRLLTHRFQGRREGGYAMTYAMLASIVKYPFDSSFAEQHGKFGFFHSEQHYFERIAEAMGMKRLSGEGEPLRYARHPLVYLVEAADDICYEVMDLEDAHKMQLLSYDEVRALMFQFFDDKQIQHIEQRIAEEQLMDENEVVVYLRANVIGLLEQECANAFLAHQQEILDGSFDGPLIDHISERAAQAYRECAYFSRRRIYNSKPVLDVELSGYRIIQTLLSHYTEAILQPYRFYSRQLLGRVASQYEVRADDLGQRLHAVVDYLSGMTDLYALDLYQKISGMSLPVV